MQTQFQLVSCIHTCTNETHSVVNLQDIISTLASKFVLPIIITAKVGIKSCRFATECAAGEWIIMLITQGADAMRDVINLSTL